MMFVIIAKETTNKNIKLEDRSTAIAKNRGSNLRYGKGSKSCIHRIPDHMMPNHTKTNTHLTINDLSKYILVSF
jgi:hypothetical protein